MRKTEMGISKELKLLLGSDSPEKDDELFVDMPQFSKRLCHQQSPKEAPFDPKEQLSKFLENVLAQRWIWCEFIESGIDETVLRFHRSMESYLKECPMLITRNLPRRCWQLIRRQMKNTPRRFSDAFIAKEKSQMNHCREIVRQLQNNDKSLIERSQSMGIVPVLPLLLPMVIPENDQVVALLTKPMPGIYKGSVLQYDPIDGHYTVNFKVAGRDKLLRVADYHLHPLEPKFTECTMTANDEEQDMLVEANETQQTLLSYLKQLRKLYSIKERTVNDIALMNEEFQLQNAGRLQSRRDNKPTAQRQKLHRRYTSNITTLHRVNAELLEVLTSSNNYVMSYELEAQQNQDCRFILQKCRSLAELTLIKASPEYSRSFQPSVRRLIIQLTSVLYMFGELGKGRDQEVNYEIEQLLAGIMFYLPPNLHSAFKSIKGQLQLIQCLISGVNS